jgi:hypothetical protein
MKYLLLIYLPETKMHNLPKEEAGQLHGAQGRRSVPYA